MGPKQRLKMKRNSFVSPLGLDKVASLLLVTTPTLLWHPLYTPLLHYLEVRKPVETLH